MPLEQPPSCHHGWNISVSGLAGVLGRLTVAYRKGNQPGDITNRVHTEASRDYPHLSDCKLSLLEIPFLDSDRQCLGLQPSVPHRSLTSGFLLSVGESGVLGAPSGSFLLSWSYSVTETDRALYLTWIQGPGLASCLTSDLSSPAVPFLYGSGWPQSHRSACLCLLSAGIKGTHH